MAGGYVIRFAPIFERDLKALPRDIREQVMGCIEDVGQVPIPQSRRPHAVTPKGQRPVIYTVDVTGNKSHKMSYMIRENVVYLLRVGTHKMLDRDPGRKSAKERC